MKNVNVKEGQIGLVFKKDKYLNILSGGTYWFWKGEKVYVYDKGTAFTSPINANVLLQNSEIVAELDIVEIADNEMVLQFEENRFKAVLTTGKHLFWKGLVNNTFVKIDTSSIEIDESIDKQLLTRISHFVRSYTVESYEKGLLIVDGKFIKVLESGTYNWWKNSTTITVAKTDIRQLQLEVSGQEILTKDKATLRLNFYVQYKVVDIEKALFKNKEYEKQLYVLMQFALREYVGSLTLDELLDKKDLISDFIANKSNKSVTELGIELNTTGIRDIILTGEMKEIMNQVLVAEKRAQANIIMRREETASMRSMLNTAKLMEENETLWKLKEMEYVEKIADKINNISVSGSGQIFDQLKQIFVKS
jgi:SPFH domain / Band 7 family